MLKVVNSSELYQDFSYSFHCVHLGRRSLFFLSWKDHKFVSFLPECRTRMLLRRYLRGLPQNFLKIMDKPWGQRAILLEDAFIDVTGYRKQGVECFVSLGTRSKNVRFHKHIPLWQYIVPQTNPTGLKVIYLYHGLL